MRLYFNKTITYILFEVFLFFHFSFSDLMKRCMSYRSRHLHKILQFREDFIQRKHMDDTCCEIVRNLADKAPVRQLLDVVFTFKRELRVQDYVLDELVQTYADR